METYDDEPIKHTAYKERVVSFLEVLLFNKRHGGQSSQRPGMKRGMLLALLAMALPTAASASSIDFTTGNFAAGQFNGSLTTTITASVSGSNNITITMTTGPLSMVGTGLYTFSGGTIKVFSGSAELFADSLASINVITVSGTTVGILAGLSPFTFNGFRVTNAIGNVNVVLAGNTVIDGNGSASLTTSEPSTLGLLGAGLFGLAGMAKRKLRPET